MEIKIVIDDPVGSMIREMKNPKCSKTSIAYSYAKMVSDVVEGSSGDQGVREVNQAIIEKWNESTFMTIKEQAWHLYLGSIDRIEID